MANASETYQAVLARPFGLSKERLRLAAGIAGAAVLVVAFVTIEPLRHAAAQFFSALTLFAALVAG